MLIALYKRSIDFAVLLDPLETGEGDDIVMSEMENGDYAITKYSELYRCESPAVKTYRILAIEKEANLKQVPIFDWRSFQISYKVATMMADTFKDHFNELSELSNSALKNYLMMYFPTLFSKIIKKTGWQYTKSQMIDAYLQGAVNTSDSDEGLINFEQSLLVKEQAPVAIGLKAKEVINSNGDRVFVAETFINEDGLKEVIIESLVYAPNEEPLKSTSS